MTELNPRSLKAILNLMTKYNVTELEHGELKLVRQQPEQPPQESAPAINPLKIKKHSQLDDLLAFNIDE